MHGSVVRVQFSVPQYWFAGQSELNLESSPTSSSADTGLITIVCMGSMFTSNQTTPAEPQHVIGSFAPIDNPIMSWDGNASLRTLISHDPRLATMIHQFSNVQSNFSGGRQDWEEWAANYKGCSVDVFDKVSGAALYSLSNVKVTAENIAMSARAVLARDVQFNHLGNF